jgi:hypothetical protein
VKDQLNDLMPWLEKLQESLVKVNHDGDHEEIERRSQLAKFVLCLAPLTCSIITLYRSLEEIGMRSLALSRKKKLARVLDKTRDSQEVVKLVEKLRQAILVYQVSARVGRQSQSGVIDVWDRYRNNSQFITRSSIWP